jgi:miniconductance mechanosensitive channel
MEALKDWLVQRGLDTEQVEIVNMLAGAGLLLLAAIVAHFLTKVIVRRLVKTAVRRSKTTWDDALVEAKVFSRLAHLVPGVIIQSAAPTVFAATPKLASAVSTATFVYMTVMGMLVIGAGLNAVVTIYRNTSASRRVPIKTFVQVAKLIVYCMGGLAILAIFLGKSPLVLVSGFGAFTAVIGLIFKDSILGLAAGIQISANDMVRRGDWISMPDHGADGDVLEVSLTTVKVQNWDKTITTIPSYALVAESFRNWRGMEESGGRRIKRAVNIDVTSIRFCDKEMLERFKRIKFISEYVEHKHEELRQYNAEHADDDTLLVNGRHMTNVGTFRAYLEAYLRHHPKVHKNMTFLVRQLPPSERGLPIEIYVFSNDQAWASYESIQADIFDHILAVIPLFDLRVFQSPTGADLRAFSGATPRNQATG